MTSDAASISSGDGGQRQRGAALWSPFAHWDGGSQRGGPVGCGDAHVQVGMALVSGTEAPHEAGMLTHASRAQE